MILQIMEVIQKTFTQVLFEVINNLLGVLMLLFVPSGSFASLLSDPLLIPDMAVSPLCVVYCLSIHFL